MNNNKLNCPFAKKCGGCQLQNMDYNRQLKFKQAKVVKLLGKFHRVNNIIGMKTPYNYRNKVSSAFGLTRSGKIVSGVYQSSEKRIVNVDKCMINNEIADEIVLEIRKMLPKFKIVPYNEFNHKGFLRHILVKQSFSTKQIMVVIVGATNIFAQKDKFAKSLVNKFPFITTVVFNINESNSQTMLLGEKNQILFGEGYIEDELFGLRFRISPNSFYQINPIQTEVLYKTAIEYANLSKEDIVLDAYCGTGTIGLSCADKAKQVIGVEINSEAVKDAKINAKINNIKNASFYNMDASDFINELAENDEKIDVVIMDPARKGSDKKFLNSVLKLSPKKIVYVSCNPETQKRDLFTLVKGGYKVRKIQPVDMFPHTTHVETVVLLTK